MKTENYQLDLNPPYATAVHERSKMATYVIKRGLEWPKELKGDALFSALDMIQKLTARLPLTAFVGEKRAVRIIFAVSNRVEFWVEDPEHPDAPKQSIIFDEKDFTPEQLAALSERMKRKPWDSRGWRPNDEGHG